MHEGIEERRFPHSATSIPRPNMKKRRIAADIAYISVSVALIAVCSWISVPSAVPFTLQTFAVFLALNVLGGKRGTIAVAVYILLGAVGVPVFSGFKGGAAALFGVTGGYIAGFLFAALVYWTAETVFGRSTAVVAISMALGLTVCYAFGTAWFTVVYSDGDGKAGFLQALTMCVLPYILPDALKIFMAVYIGNRVKKFVNADSRREARPVGGTRNGTPR